MVFGRIGFAPMSAASQPTMRWHPERPQLRPLRLVVGWVISALSLLFAALVLPNVTVSGFWGALLIAALIAILNALVPPVIAALRLPFTLITSFLLILFLDAVMLRIASEAFPGAMHISNLGRALVVSLLAAAAAMVITILAGMDDDDEYTLRVTQRIARRTGNVQRTDVPGVIYLEIDGLGLPVLQRAMRDGNAPEMARWLADGSHHMVEWQTDLSSQTGASQAGILLGSNEDIPAFRWVDKRTGRVIACSGPDDCAEMEKRLATGVGLLVGGGASRGNLFSGEADATILTVSRLSAEKKANPGYRSFFANGFNVTRVLVLFFFELGLEWVAAIRGIRRNVQPRGHRGGKYPFIRAGMCVVVRDLIVHGVLSDMMQGRAAVYATFSSYDEVAHHSGLERADTLEALRKLDEQFGRIMRACRYAPRPYRIVVLSDHGQTQGATFRQRNGYGLDDLVRRSLESGSVGEMSGAEEAQAMVGHALTEATGRDAKDPDGDESKPEGEDVIVLGSGNLGLLYLMNHPERQTLEQIESEHPRLIPALRAHPHVGWLLVRAASGPVVLGATGSRDLVSGAVEGDDPLAPFGPEAAQHLARTDGFSNVADIMIGSFYSPDLEQGCAFEELISFHGGLGGPQTRPFILYPVELAAPEQPILGAARVHEILSGWRRDLQGEFVPQATVTPAPAPDAAAT
jgi:uncharacterized membrane protein YvlD (DUF360 family)